MNWSVGGWFGGQLGATVWMLVAGILTAIRDYPIGMFVVLLFAIPNVIGVVLWLSRRFSCYVSTQLLMVVSGLCGLLTVNTLENANAWMKIQTGGQVTAQSSYWIIGLVYGGLILLFHIRYGRVKNDPKA
jgi:fluoride ion exporter CrcB/FEX